MRGGTELTDQALDRMLRQVLLDVERQQYRDAIDELPECDFSPAFEKKMQKLIHRADHPVRYRGLRTIQIAAILAALLMLVTMATAAAGYDIWKMLAEWTAENIALTPWQIEYANPDDLHIPEGPGEYADIQEALTDYGINRPLIPRYLPDGFAAEQLIVDKETNPNHIVFLESYHRETDYIIIQAVIHLDNENEKPIVVEEFFKDEGEPVPYEAGGITHLLTTNGGRPSALWANGPAECSITSDITMEELKQMIDSIYE